MNAKQLVRKAVKDNPEVCLVLEIAARAREVEGREPVKELGATTSIGANPTAAQGVIQSGCVLKDERNLIS